MVKKKKTKCNKADYNNVRRIDLHTRIYINILILTNIIFLERKKKCYINYENLAHSEAKVFKFYNLLFVRLDKKYAVMLC